MNWWKYVYANEFKFTLEHTFTWLFFPTADFSFFHFNHRLLSLFVIFIIMFLRIILINMELRFDVWRNLNTCGFTFSEWLCWKNKKKSLNCGLWACIMTTILCFDFCTSKCCYISALKINYANIILCFLCFEFKVAL